VKPKRLDSFLSLSLFICDQVERGEQKIQRQADIMAAVKRKIERYRDPYNELRLSYGPNKGKAFSEEEDRFLLCKVRSQTKKSLREKNN
jgi:hypothetical protein